MLLTKFRWYFTNKSDAKSSEYPIEIETHKTINNIHGMVLTDRKVTVLVTVDVIVIAHAVVV